MSRTDHSCRAFTLVELLIIIAILGILAALVIPRFSDNADNAARAAFVTSGRTFARSAKRYQLDTGQWLENSDSGTLPNGLAPYITEDSWTSGTPLGGVWDSELNSFGIVSALGVHFDGTGATRDDAYMIEVDVMIDDGDLTTGGFRKLGADRYYFVLAD